MSVLTVLTLWPAFAFANPWQRTDIDGTNALRDISCEGFTLCGTVDSSGQLLYLTPDSGTPWKRYRLDRNSGVQTQAVSCFTALDCASVDSGGHAVWAENRSPWVQATGAVDSGHKLTDISCVARGGLVGTFGFCGAVDGQGRFVVTNNPLGGAGATWSNPASIDDGAPLTALACPSSALCLAADSAGRILLSTDPGSGLTSHWTRPMVDRGHKVNDLECVTRNPASNKVAICAAVDSSGKILTTTNPIAGAWSARSIDSRPLVGVSCTSTSLCVAVDRAGHAIASGTPTGRSSSWKTTQIADHPLAAVSCLQINFECFAVDNAGDVYHTTDAVGSLP